MASLIIASTVTILWVERLKVCQLPQFFSTACGLERIVCECRVILWWQKSINHEEQFAAEEKIKRGIAGYVVAQRVIGKGYLWKNSAQIEVVGWYVHRNHVGDHPGETFYHPIGLWVVYHWPLMNYGAEAHKKFQKELSIQKNGHGRRWVLLVHHTSEWLCVIGTRWRRQLSQSEVVLQPHTEWHNQLLLRCTDYQQKSL